MHEDQDIVDAIDADEDALEDIEVIDPQDAPAASCRALKTRPASAGAVVPYQPAQLPAVIPQLGDLEAYIRAANLAPILSAEQEHDLAVRLRDTADLSAAQQLVLSHLRLVVSVARGYLGYGLPYADLIQEGNIGLMKAIKHFDPDRGVRLMTFSVHWIRSEIQEYVVRNWRLVKLATTKNQRKLFFNLRQMKDSDKTLTTEETERIAQTLDVKPEEVREMEARMSGGDTSIDGRSDPDEDSSGTPAMAPIDWLSREEDEPETILEEKSREETAREHLKKAINSLDARSQHVIRSRWLNEDAQGNNAPKTLQELADELGVSAERVRQIEKKALIKMREALLASKEDID